MKPSVLKPILKNQTGTNKTYMKKIGCPDGTVPISRISKEHISNTQLFPDKYFHPLTGDSPGTHVSIKVSFNSLILVKIYIYIYIYQVCVCIYRYVLIITCSWQIAGVWTSNGPYRGVEAWFSIIHNLNIGRDQASYTQIYIGSGLNNEVNFIEAGWMVGFIFD